MAGYTLDASWLAGGPHLSDFFSDIFGQPDYDPAGLAVSMAGQDATLTWYASPSGEGVTSYDLYRRTPATGARFVAGSDTPVATGVTSPYVDAGLAAGTYEWEVIGDIATNPYAAFTGYYAEYDFSKTGSITASGGKISQINDQNGGTPATQATSANQPLTGSDTINGLNVGTFSKANSTLLLADIADQSQPITVYVVCQITDSSEVADSSPTQYELLGSSSGVGGLRLGHQFGFYNAEAGSDFGYVVAPEVTSAHIVGAVLNNASSVQFVDSTEGTGTAGTAGLYRIQIGNRDAGDKGITGKIGHVLVYTAAHDATTRGNVRAALQSQWATP